MEGKKKSSPNNDELINAPDVPFIAFQSEMARAERHIIRLWAALLLVIVLLVATNAAWIWYEAQFEDVVTETIETSTEGGGDAYGTIISGDNSEVHYGESQNNQN